MYPKFKSFKDYKNGLAWTNGITHKYLKTRRFFTESIHTLNCCWIFQSFIKQLKALTFRRTLLSTNIIIKFGGESLAKRKRLLLRSWGCKSSHIFYRTLLSNIKIKDWERYWRMTPLNTAFCGFFPLLTNKNQTIMPAV